MITPANIFPADQAPPQSIDCEEAVLGILLVSPESINEVAADLKPEMFYKSAHQVIYKRIIETFKAFNNVDFITVSEKLRDNNELESVGGPVYLSKLTGKIISDANIETYVNIIKQKSLLRDYIRVAHEIISSAYQGDLDETAEKAENGLLSIAGQLHSNEPVRLDNVIYGVIAKIQKIQNHEIKLVGVPSGFTRFDRMTGGFKDGELIILAGRPSMGKTALALQIAQNAGEIGNGVAVFSCEMSKEALGQRVISGVSDKTNVELMQGNCNIDELLKKTERFIGVPMFIDDTSSISLLEMRAKTRKLMIKNNIKMVFVDYLQLMKGEDVYREQEVAGISRGLKAIAKDLNIPVIALSQMNRKAEERGERRPQLSDLRESGAIEQDADMVLFVYRPAKYGLRSVVVDGQEKETAGLMEVIIEKNRNGAVGSFYLNHNVSVTRMTDEEELTF